MQTRAETRYGGSLSRGVHDGRGEAGQGDRSRGIVEVRGSPIEWGRGGPSSLDKQLLNKLIVVARLHQLEFEKR